MGIIQKPTYVYIDVSNIRYACLASCGFNLDFIKFYQYLKRKYPGKIEARYYEGIAEGDEKKKKHFTFLEKKVGHRVCSLSRKSYTEPAKYKTFNCGQCGAPNSVKILPKNTKLKSNVDVYIASEMLKCVACTTEETRIILVSCDGDYAEAIQAALELNPKVEIIIMATPATKKNNCLSARLQVFANRKTKRTSLVNIASIKDYISQPLQELSNPPV